MKKILTVLLFFSISFSYGQAPITSYAVPSISSMKGYFGNANRIYVTGTNEDYFLCSSCIADEASVYAGSSGKKWKKITFSVDTVTYIATKTDLTSKADNSGTADIEITDFNRGVILWASDNSRWRLTVSTSGVVSGVSVSTTTGSSISSSYIPADNIIMADYTLVN